MPEIIAQALGDPGAAARRARPRRPGQGAGRGRAQGLHPRARRPGQPHRRQPRPGDADLGGAFDNFAKIASSVRWPPARSAPSPTGSTRSATRCRPRSPTSIRRSPAPRTPSPRRRRRSAAPTARSTPPGTAIGNADAVLQAKLPEIMDDLSETTATLSTAVAEISTGANRVVTQAGNATDAATARMNEIKATIANIDATLAEDTDRPRLGLGDLGQRPHAGRRRGHRARHRRPLDPRRGEARDRVAEPDHERGRPRRSSPR